MRKSTHRGAPVKQVVARGAKGLRPPSAGAWVWACREGFEDTLIEELERGGGRARAVMPGLVESGPARQTPAFARVGFQVSRVLREEPGAAAQAAAAWAGPVWIQAWVPDSELGNAEARRARRFGGEVLRERVAAGLPLYPTAKEAERQRAELAQLLVLPGGLIALGSIDGAERSVRAPGGRSRMHRDHDSPSRAAMKLEEALEWLGEAPQRGDACVDLGAAPGGWTERLLKLGARVTAVDPARLRPDLMEARALVHARCSAFEFEPAEPVEWLFCDMAWRPLEVAQLLARWARRGWAGQLVANLKLPMKDKVALLERARDTLTEGGWKGLRLRHLYHDREEVTVLADRRGP